MRAIAKIRCRECEGQGRMICGTCNGSGCSPNGPRPDDIGRKVPCGACGGIGEVLCRECLGEKTEEFVAAINSNETTADEFAIVLEWMDEMGHDFSKQGQVLANRGLLKQCLVLAINGIHEEPIING